MNFIYKFSVVKGVQAFREYYIGMVPLGLLSKLFQNEQEYISPDNRAQRCINEARIPEIRDYILENRNNYVFSALSASIDGNFKFIASDLDENLGVLEVEMDSIFLINDGQHRKAAIEAALKEDAGLAKETIAIVFFKDEGLKRSQQMFADLNKHAVKSTMSLSTLYDDRDDLANAVKDVVRNIEFLNKYTDKEKDNLGKNSSKLFTLANFVRANRRIIKDNEFSNSCKNFLHDYWTAIFTYIEEWDKMEKKDIPKCALREEYILALAVTMLVFGRLGRYFFESEANLEILQGLSKIDWLRGNTDWVGRLIDSNGRILTNEDAIIKTCAYIKSCLGIELTKEEAQKNNGIKR